MCDCVTVILFFEISILPIVVFKYFCCDIKCISYVERFHYCIVFLDVLYLFEGHMVRTKTEDKHPIKQCWNIYHQRRKTKLEGNKLLLIQNINKRNDTIKIRYTHTNTHVICFLQFPSSKFLVISLTSLYIFVYSLRHFGTLSTMCAYLQSSCF